MIKLNEINNEIPFNLKKWIILHYSQQNFPEDEFKIPQVTDFLINKSKKYLSSMSNDGFIYRGIETEKYNDYKKRGIRYIFRKSPLSWTWDIETAEAFIGSEGILLKINWKPLKILCVDIIMDEVSKKDLEKIKNLYAKKQAQRYVSESEILVLQNLFISPKNIIMKKYD